LTLFLKKLIKILLVLFLPSDEGRWPKAGGVDMRSIKTFLKAFGIKPPPPYGVLPLIRGGEERLRRVISHYQKRGGRSEKIYF